MYWKLYIKQAWNLFKQNRFFSAIYVVGTGLAISMVMVLAVVYHIRTANIAPESHRDRVCYLSDASYKADEGNMQYQSNLGRRLAREVFGHMQTPEAVSLSTNPNVIGRFGQEIFVQVPGGDDSPRVSYRACNAGFWRVFDFSFIDGKAFTEEEFQSGVRTAVISRSLARRLYHKEKVAGETLLLNDVAYRISGVVEDVSSLFPNAYAELWFPYTASIYQMGMNVAQEFRLACGTLEAVVLMRQAKDFPAVQQEFDEAMKRFNTTLTEGKAETPPLERSSFTISGIAQKDIYIAFALLTALFLLVPALNLSGLNASQIQGRLEEIGIRKAFGASRRSLFMQVFVENLVLMLPGGVLGLLFSFVWVHGFKDILLTHDLWTLVLGVNGNNFLTVGMLLDPWVFVVAFGVCLALNLLSSWVPVWRAVRTPIVNALNM